MSVRCRTRMVDLRLHNIERATPFWTWFLFVAAPICWASEAIGTRPLEDRPDARMVPPLGLDTGR